MQKFRDMDPLELSSLGDGYVNLVYSMALSEAAGRPMGKKVPNRVLSTALERAGLRELAGSRVSAHQLADLAEGIIFKAWLEGRITLEESVRILSRSMSGSTDRKTQWEDAVEAFTAMLRAVKEGRTRGKTPLLTVDAVVEREGEILLVRRLNPPFQGKWALPGGFVEYGERVEDAAHRELEEETGLRIRITGLLGVYSEPGRDPRGHVVSVCYIAEGEGEVRGGSDAAEARFFKPGDIDFDNLAFDHDRIIKDYMRWKCSAKNAGA
jgi:8-oxo-dGTP diphosphatase